MRSIKSVLAEAAARLATHSDSATLDAEVLLCHVLDKPRTYLRTWPDQSLAPAHATAFWELIEKRQKGVPVAYITGSREFWSRDFKVTPEVLIPRPDTELLVELGLKLLPADKPVKIIDLGTGSGIIAITLAAECPHAHISASDVSEAALRIARQNADSHHIHTLHFYQSDWFASIPATQFNLVISNPPYLAEDDSHLQNGGLQWEPQQALIADRQGLGDIRIIIDTARHYLEIGGHLLIEHGCNQQQLVQAIFNDFSYSHVQTYTDLSGQPRVTYGQWS